MKQSLLEEKIFAIIFLIAIVMFGGVSAYQTLDTISWDITHTETDTDSIFTLMTEDISIIEDDIADHIYGRYTWIEFYGLVNRLIGKKEINGFSYAVDEQGAYEPVNFWSDAKDIDFRTYAQQLVLFRDDVEANGGHFLFLLFPHKMNDAWDTGYTGIPYNDFNEQADTLLEWLDFYGVDYIDFRETLKDSGLSFNEMFYKTDHHWTGYAAFLAFQDLIDYMNDEYDANLDPDFFYRDVNNYDIEWIENTFLGASGRNVGLEFGNITELEDFQTVTPKFDLNIEWTNSDGETFDSLMMPETVEYNEQYKSDAYRFYMSGVNARDTIVNEDSSDAPSLYFIRDSFASPLIMDMAPLFSQISCSWGKKTSDRYVKDEVVASKPDYVFVGYYPENLTEEFFKFYADDVEQYKLDYAKSQGYMEEGE